MVVANAPEIRDSHRLRDKKLLEVVALPGAGLTTYSLGIDMNALTGFTAKGAILADFMIRVSVPNLGVGHLVNADTLGISIILDSAQPLDASSKVLMADLISMLGAGGVGDTKESVTLRVPPEGLYYQGTLYRWIGVKMVHTGTGDPSTANLTMELLF